MTHEKRLKNINHQGNKNQSEHSERHFTPTRMAIVKKIVTNVGEL